VVSVFCHIIRVFILYLQRYSQLRSPARTYKF
jgi:hypothetical protein